jgi:hypothetical protein
MRTTLWMAVLMALYELIIDQMTEKAAEMPETKRQSYLDSAPLVASEMVNTDIVYVKL